MKKISIIIPVYNEEKRIIKCIEKIDEYFLKQSYTFEIIFVDDGCKDQTIKIIQEKTKNKNNFFLLPGKKNYGKGHAIRQGVFAAKGEYILFTDADLSTPINEIEKLLPYIEKYPVVIGSRYLKKDSIKIKQPFTRRAISRFGNLLVKLVLGLSFADTQCGFKLFQNMPAKKIFKKSQVDRWAFDMEILSIAKCNRYPIKEVAVNWYNDSYSQLRAGRDAYNTFKELILIKKNLIKEKYKINEEITN